MSILWAVIDGLMAVSAILFGLRLLLLVVCAAWDVLRRRLKPLLPHPPEAGEWPSLTVLVPAFNEERVLAGTVLSALRNDYHRLRVVVVDDGSSDATADVARRLAQDDPRVECVVLECNQGKAAALNVGLGRADTEVVVSLDADTVLAPDALRWLVAPVLRGADACSCNLRVGNRRGWLLRWQSVEHVVGLNLGRRAQATLGCITTIPGAAAAFRRQTLMEVGGWSGDTRTEDTDLTLTLLEAGHRVVYEPRALAFTEAPERFVGLLRQRTRWMHGYLACIWKHRRASLRLDAFGLFGMPNLVFLHLLVFPLMLVALPYTARLVQWTSPGAVLGFLLGYLWLDSLIALLCYLVDRQHPGEVVHAPLWRLGWPFFLLLVFFRTWARILSGRDVPWDKLERTGSVADAIPASSSLPR